MILEADFLVHHKTKFLEVVLGDDDRAPLYIIRLWLYCQLRRVTHITANPTTIKSICQFRGDAGDLVTALKDAGFLDTVENDPTIFEVHDFEKYNGRLTSCWKNGQKGGRPKGISTKPTHNPQGTHQEPTHNPQGTHQEPTHNPQGTHQEPTHNPENVREGEGEGEGIPPNPPGGESEGDVAHLILLSCRELKRLSWASDLAARRSWPHEGIDWEEVAEEAVKVAENERGGIRNPYTWWLKRCEMAFNNLNMSAGTRGGSGPVDSQMALVDAMRRAGVN